MRWRRKILARVKRRVERQGESQHFQVPPPLSHSALSEINAQVGLPSFWVRVDQQVQHVQPIFESATPNLVNGFNQLGFFVQLCSIF